jgi:hypothetical protein
LKEKEEEKLEDMYGGETTFPRIGVSVAAQSGRAVVFSNQVRHNGKNLTVSALDHQAEPLHKRSTPKLIFQFMSKDD